MEHAINKTMSLESFFSGKGAPKYLQSMSNCLLAIGSPEFNSQFLDLIENVIRADQCMIFSYKTDRPDCYLSYIRRHKKSALNIAQRYLREGYRDDPLRPVVNKVRDTGQTVICSLSEIQTKMSEEYYDTYFNARGISDKISVISARRDEALVLNFYRFEENGHFGVSEDSLRVPFWGSVASMALLHFLDPDSLELKTPLNSLSTREKAICEAMLNGMTTDSIAWRLDISPSTVKTYRQRAYAKLGINSKAALFALCRNP